jgi:hypothetical protein
VNVDGATALAGTPSSVTTSGTKSVRTLSATKTKTFSTLSCEAQRPNPFSNSPHIPFAPSIFRKSFHRSIRVRRPSRLVVAVGPDRPRSADAELASRVGNVAFLPVERRYDDVFVPDRTAKNR